MLSLRGGAAAEGGALQSHGLAPVCACHQAASDELWRGPSRQCLGDGPAHQNRATQGVAAGGSARRGRARGRVRWAVAWLAHRGGEAAERVQQQLRGDAEGRQAARDDEREGRRVAERRGVPVAAHHITTTFFETWSKKRKDRGVIPHLGVPGTKNGRYLGYLVG